MWSVQKQYLLSTIDTGEKLPALEKKAVKLIENLEILSERIGNKNLKIANKIIIRKTISQIENLYTQALSETEQVALGNSIIKSNKILRRSVSEKNA